MILCAHCGERLADLHCPECDRPAPPPTPLAPPPIPPARRPSAPAPLSRFERAAMLAATELGGPGAAGDASTLLMAGQIVRADDEELPS